MPFPATRAGIRDALCVPRSGAGSRLVLFARAAAELGVTPPAVSHQIRQLKEFLGVPLFRRITRRVQMTEAGQALLPKLTEGFDMLAEALAALRNSDKAGPLMVSVAPSFATKWLLSNAESFRAAHPDIDLRISSNIAIVDFRADEVDVAIRFRHGHCPGFKVD
jgi:LysR family glycine cleavage system transcriptional activator